MRDLSGGNPPSVSMSWVNWGAGIGFVASLAIAAIVVVVGDTAPVDEWMGAIFSLLLIPPMVGAVVSLKIGEWLGKFPQDRIPCEIPPEVEEAARERFFKKRCRLPRTDESNSPGAQ